MAVTVLVLVLVFVLRKKEKRSEILIRLMWVLNGRTQFRCAVKTVTGKRLSSNNNNDSGDLSFAMSCSGWLLPFHLGVIDRLKSTGHMNETTVYSGSSGGSIAALVACSGISANEALSIIMGYAKDKEFKKNIDAGMKKCLASMCPDDILRKVDKRLHITVTKAWPNPEMKTTVISEFRSAQELIDVVAASCFIPLYGGTPLQLFTKLDSRHARDGTVIERNFYLDGGVFALMPPICKVRVAPVPKSAHFLFGRRVPHIYPEETDFKKSDLLVWGLNPPSSDKIQKLFDKGVAAADRWIASRK